MTYEEKKTEDGFHYTNRDIYGIIELWSEKKLDADRLDRIVGYILQSNHSEGIINGIKFTYKFDGNWLKD